MSRPIRRGEAAPEQAAVGRVLPQRSPLEKLTHRMITRFGDAVRASPPHLPPDVRELPSSLLSVTDAQTHRLATQLLGKELESAAAPAAPSGSSRAEIRAIAASVAKAETPGAGFQFLRGLVMVLTLGIVRLQQKRPLTDWVQQRLKQGAELPATLTPSFCAEVICLKQLHRGLLEQSAPAAEKVAAKLGQLLDQYQTALEGFKAPSKSPVAQDLASALLDDLRNADSPALDSLLHAIVRHQLSAWTRELPAQIQAAIQAPSPGPEVSGAAELARDLEIVQQLLDSPQGSPLKSTLAGTFPLGLPSARSNLQAAWSVPEDQLIDHLGSVARLLRAYSPFFQSAQASAGSLPEAGPGQWLAETYPSDTQAVAGLERALEREAEQLASLAVGTSSLSPQEAREAFSSRLSGLARLAGDVPKLAGQSVGERLAAEIGGHLQSHGSPAELVRILTHVQSLLAGVSAEDQKALGLAHLTRDAWNATSLKQTVVTYIENELLTRAETELAAVLTGCVRDLSELQTLVGRSALRPWVTEALTLAVKQKDGLRSLAQEQLLEGAIDLVWLGPQPSASDTEWADALKDQLRALRQISPGTELPARILQAALPVAQRVLRGALGAQQLIQRTEQLAVWAQLVQSEFPSADALAFLRDALLEISAPSEEEQAALSRSMIDGTHRLLREPVTTLGPRDMAALALLSVGPITQQGAGGVGRWADSAPGEIAQSYRLCPPEELAARGRVLEQIGAAIDQALQVSESANWLADGLEIALQLQAEELRNALTNGTSSKPSQDKFSKMWEIAGSHLPPDRIKAIAGTLTDTTRAWAQDLTSSAPLTPNLLQTKLPWDSAHRWGELVRQGGAQQIDQLVGELDETPAEGVAEGFCLAARKMGAEFKVPPPSSAAAVQGLIKLHRDLGHPDTQSRLREFFPNGQQGLDQARTALQTTLQTTLGPKSSALQDVDASTLAAILQEALTDRLVEAPSIPATLNSYLVRRLSTGAAGGIMDALQGSTGPVADLIRVITSQLVMARPSMPELPITADELERMLKQVNWSELAKAFPGQASSFSYQLLGRAQTPQELQEALQALVPSPGMTLQEPLPNLIADAMGRLLRNVRTASDRAQLAELLRENRALLRSLPQLPVSVAAYLLPTDQLRALFDQEIPSAQLGRLLTALNLRIQEARPEDELDRDWLGEELYNRFKSPDATIQPSKDLFFEDETFTPLARTMIQHAALSGMAYADFLPMLFHQRGLSPQELDRVAAFTKRAEAQILETLSAPARRKGIPAPEEPTVDPAMINRLSPQLLLGWLQDHPETSFSRGIASRLTQRLMEAPEMQLADLPEPIATPVQKTPKARVSAKEILAGARTGALNRIEMRRASAEATQRSLLETRAERSRYQERLLKTLSAWRDETIKVAKGTKPPSAKELKALLTLGEDLAKTLDELVDAGVQLPKAEADRTSKFVEAARDIEAWRAPMLLKLDSLPLSPARDELLHLVPQIKTNLAKVVPR